MRFFVLVLALALAGCGEKASVENVLRPRADWKALEAYGGVLTREEFERAMDEVYAPKADWREWIRVEAAGAWVVGEAGERHFVEFAKGLGRAADEWSGGLAGLRVAIDPGHLGGEWGAMEHRSFAIDGGPVVQEGDLTLATARRLERTLEQWGAEVLLLRSEAGPVTSLRPEDFREEAELRLPGVESEELLAKRGGLANLLFYRSAEIRARADRLADWGGADLALVLHINARSDPGSVYPGFYDGNDAHILVNGCYMKDELARPNQRFEMLLRLLKGYHREERRIGEVMAAAMREATGLPAYRYTGDNASLVGGGGYLWARNLMASRIYDCPVVYFEPWRANSPEVYEWAAAGDYEGERAFAGKLRKSLPSVYSDFVAEGLRRLFAR